MTVALAVMVAQRLNSLFEETLSEDELEHWATQRDVEKRYERLSER